MLRGVRDVETLAWYVVIRSVTLVTLGRLLVDLLNSMHVINASQRNVHPSSSMQSLDFRKQDLG